MPATATKPRSARNGSTPPAELFEIPVDRIVTGDNVRTDVGDVDLLATSIQEVGILQPLRVEQGDGGFYLLKIGHRRLAAAQQLGMTQVPAIVDSDLAVGVARPIQQLVENIQRRDLNPLEEAAALRGILDASKGMTQDELAAKVGRSRPAVTNLLRILDTVPAVQAYVASGELTAAHAKAIAGLPPKEQEGWAARAVQSNSSAHSIEESIARDREWRQRQATEAKETAKQRDERVTKALVKLPDKTARIVIAKGYYSNAEEPVLRRLQKAGYTNVSIGQVSARKDTLDCDCGVTMIDVGYGGGISIKPGCVEKKHRDAKWKADTAASERQRSSEARIRETIQEHLRVALSTLDPKAARVLLWSSLEWSLNEWVKEHKGDRKKPDAWAQLAELEQPVLAAEIAKFVAKAFTDRYGVKLDWPAVAEAFGVDLPEPAKPKAKAGKAAAA